MVNRLENTPKPKWRTVGLNSVIDTVRLSLNERPYKIDAFLKP